MMIDAQRQEHADRRAGEEQGDDRQWPCRACDHPADGQRDGDHCRQQRQQRRDRDRNLFGIAPADERAKRQDDAGKR